MSNRREEVLGIIARVIRLNVEDLGMNDVLSEDEAYAVCNEVGIDRQLPVHITVSQLIEELCPVDTFAATRILERSLFRGVPGKIDGWGFP
jgi:hypothetical protein